MRKILKRSLALFMVVLTLASSFGSALTAFALTDGGTTTLNYTLRAKANYSSTSGYDSGSVWPSTTATVAANPYYWHSETSMASGGTYNMRATATGSGTLVHKFSNVSKKVNIKVKSTTSGDGYYWVYGTAVDPSNNTAYTGYIRTDVITREINSSYRFLKAADGTVVYCIELGAGFTSGATYSTKAPNNFAYWNNLTTEAKDGIQLALLYGYPNYTYGATPNDAYAATQAIIWEYQSGWRTSAGRNSNEVYNPAANYPSNNTNSKYTYAGIKNKPAEAPYNSIVNAINNHLTKPSFTKASATLADASPVTMTYNSSTGKWTATLTDSNNVLSNFTVTSNNSGVSVSKSGNTLTLTASSPNVNGARLTLNKNLPTSTQSLLVLNVSGSQTCIAGSVNDPVTGYVALKAQAVSATLKINKTNEAGSAVANAKYGVYSNSACTTSLGTITTNSSGTGSLSINLTTSPMTVYVKELSLGTSEAALYKLDSATHSYTLTSGQTTTANLKDDWQDARFTLTKMDSTGNTISGVTFTAYSDSNCTTILKDINGSNVTVKTSGGTATSAYIDVGTSGSKTIYIKETAMDSTAASKYVLDTTTKYTVTLNAGKTASVNNGSAIINYWHPGYFEITKVDNLGNKLQGVSFTAYTDAACTSVLKDQKGNNVVVTTDGNGYAKSTGIDVTSTTGTRTIYLKENTLPASLSGTHTGSSSIITVTLTTDKTTTVPPVTNTVKDAKFNLTKKDDTGNALNGVQFKAYTDSACTTPLTDVNGNAVVLTTNASGVATSSSIAITNKDLTRTIYVKETLLPQSSDHNMSTTVYTVKLTAGSNTAVNNGSAIINTWKYSNFELNKVDSTGTALQGVTFTAYEDSNCNTVLKDAAGNNVTVTTDGNGHAVSSDIKVTSASGTRTIYVKETALSSALSSKYDISTKVYTVTLTAAQTAKVNDGKAIVNYWKSGKVSIHKVDDTGNNLAGIVFTAYADEACTTALKDVDGKNVVLTTTSDGTATSTNIAVDEGVHADDGTRTIWLKETSAPSSISDTHYITNTVYKLTVKSNATTAYGSDIVNKWKPAMVSIEKADDTGNKLEGVQFTAYDDEACTTIVKDTDGKDVVLGTNAEGKATSTTIDVTKGSHTADGTRTIYLKETYMPDALAFNHAMSTTPIKVVLHAGGTTAANNGSVVINYWKPAKFTLTKVDETGNKLEGATFTAYSDAACTTVIKDVDGNNVVVTTNTSGVATSKDIKILDANGKRTIYLKETAQSTALAATHNMNTSVITVVLEAAKTVTADDKDSVTGIVNTWKPGTFDFIKKDSDGKVMKEVVFKAYTDADCTTALTDIEGSAVVLTTDGNGKATSPSIKVTGADGTRTIYIKEFSVPASTTRDYAANTTAYKVVLKAGQNVTPDAGEVITNTIAHKYGKVTLTKQNENAQALADVQFTLYTDAECKTVAKDIKGNDVVLKTNTNGTATSEYVPFAGSEQSHTFYLKETSITADQQKTYNMNTQVFSVVLTEGKTTSANDGKAIINEWKNGSFDLSKIEAWENKPVKGATFGVYTDADCKNAVTVSGKAVTIITDEAGKGSATNLDVDKNGSKTYYVKEISTGNDNLYTLNTKVYSVVVNAGANSTLDAGDKLSDGTASKAIVNNRVLRYFTLMKIDEETGAGLPNCTFELTSDVKGKLGTYTTGSNGKTAEIGLPAGQYSFKETAAPVGYIVDSTVINFTIAEDGSITGPITVSNGNSQSGPTPIVPELPKPEQPTAPQNEPGTNGNTSLYTVTTGTSTKTASGDCVALVLADKPNKFEIAKTDERTGDPVVGATVTIYRIDNKVATAEELSAYTKDDAKEAYEGISSEAFNASGVTDAAGKAKFDRVPAGTYLFVETAAAPGYYKTDSIFLFSVDGDGKAAGTTSFTNAPIPTVITKTDLATSAPVPGATVVIYDADKNPIFTDVTDEDGTVTAYALKPGTYTFEETINPAGYELNTNSFEFTIGEDGTVTNGVTEFTDKPTGVTLSKKDVTTAAGVPGATITIYDDKGAKVTDGVTNGNGEVHFDYLKPGTYTFKETVAPDGYIINETTFTFTIAENGKVTGDNTVTDEQNKITLVKTDSTITSEKKFVKGATYYVYDKNNTKVAEGITDENGEIVIRKLKAGDYTFKEITAPTGYALDTTVHSFSVDTHGKVTGTTNVADDETEVTITKKDLITAAPLPGATITIYDKDNKPVFEDVTDENGEITAFKLPVGTYTFKETLAPEGYALIDGSFNFTIAADGKVTGTTEISDAPTDVTIKKIDTKANKALEGATICVYTDADCKTAAMLGGKAVSGVTNKDGEINIKYLPVGTYYYKETVAPKGFALNSTVYTFKIDAYGKVTTTDNADGTTVVTNAPTHVVIKKTDLTDSAPVPGATVEIYDSDNKLVKEYVTGPEGTFEEFYLPVGTYTFKETIAPSEYKLNTNTFTFTINEDGTVTGDKEFKDEQTHVVITKTDLTSEAPVPGAVITIYDETGAPVFEDTTDENGQVETFKLPHGTYTFVETTAPETYQRRTDSFTFTIDENGNITSDSVTSFTDAPTEVTITKSDFTTAEPVPGAEIAIYTDEECKNIAVIDGKEVKDITKEDGTITITYLPHGTYWFKETVAPSTYKMNPTIFSFTIDEDGQVTSNSDKTITDKPTEVVITKSDLTTEEPVPGATIVIYDKDGKPVFEDVTDDDGQIKATSLPHGTYTFAETIAPDEFQRNTNTFTFTIDENGEITSDSDVDFTDAPTEITLKKLGTDTGDKGLEGAQIVIYNEDEECVYNSEEDGATDENGEINITYLPHGKYTYTEVWAPDGYFIDKDNCTYNFTIDEDGMVASDSDVTFVNAPTVVKIHKVETATQQPIEGATIEVFDATGESIFKDVTDKNGEVTLTHIKVGSYTFKETAAPAEYQLNDEVFAFTIDEFGVVEGATAIEDKPTEVIFNKVDSETKEPLEGAKITIYDEDEEPVVELTSDKDGLFTYYKLPHGKYTVKETGAPVGYVLDEETVYAFEIDETGKFVCEDNFIENVKIHGEIEIGKADAEDDELMLEGAVFEIMNKDGEVVATVETNEDGVAVAENIEYGEYTVKEKEAPVGYNINASAFPVSIVYDGKTEYVDVRDSVIKGKVKVTKLNAATQEPVANAEFEILDAEGNPVETIKTDENGIANTSFLRYGNYTLHESKAPSGYIAGDDVEFSVTVEGDTVELTYYENPIVKTGSVETNNAAVTYLALAGGMFLFAAAGVTVYAATSRKKREEEN